ncbi:putative beta-1,3-galactosyltransferase 2 [Capsicum baccatum]|uniref:Beta-1,3-galactosyltransferase 2 n=1 Tax=Capsicum baccatum TaxID=33114 RepID=A0A2G2XJU6_CAPBA|nr:putative beta-1,3-galactosyltransferase 2 [Capsicum baccatum]
MKYLLWYLHQTSSFGLRIAKEHDHRLLAYSDSDWAGDPLDRTSTIGSQLDRHQSKPRMHMGCMKSGPVLLQKGVKYHEPEYWKFGEEGNKYFRHPTGQIYAIFKNLATYISINRYTFFSSSFQFIAYPCALLVKIYCLFIKNFSSGTFSIGKMLTPIHSYALCDMLVSGLWLLLLELMIVDIARFKLKTISSLYFVAK